ncbi:hypothetical protein V6N12_036626 [Hibiscus sabdariffa]|uniref:Uncharacterized protein n=1 Tax=Hibiscus sabdariffa TaxID=183260 RepID=A0ABR2ER52_9ROSI
MESATCWCSGSRREILLGENIWFAAIRRRWRQYVPEGANPMARSNMSECAESLTGRFENAVPLRISLAVSGWLLITTRVAPRLNFMSLVAPSDAAMVARLRCASGPIDGNVPSNGQPIGPGRFGEEKWWFRHAKPPGTSQ